MSLFPMSRLCSCSFNFMVSNHKFMKKNGKFKQKLDKSEPLLFNKGIGIITKMLIYDWFKLVHAW